MDIDQQGDVIEREDSGGQILLPSESLVHGCHSDKEPAAEAASNLHLPWRVTLDPNRRLSHGWILSHAREEG